MITELPLNGLLQTFVKFLQSIESQWQNKEKNQVHVSLCTYLVTHNGL